MCEMKLYILSKLHHCSRWSLGTDNKFHPTLYWAGVCLSMMGFKLTNVDRWDHRARRSAANLCKLGMRNFELELIYCRNSNNTKHKHLPKRLTISSSHELSNNEEYIFLKKLCMNLGSTIVTSTGCTIMNWYHIVVLYPILKAVCDHIKGHLIIQRS